MQWLLQIIAVTRRFYRAAAILVVAFSPVDSSEELIHISNDLPPIPNPFGFSDALALRDYLRDHGRQQSVSATMDDLIREYETQIGIEIETRPAVFLASIRLVPISGSTSSLARLGKGYPVLNVPMGETPASVFWHLLVSHGSRIERSETRYFFREYRRIQDQKSARNIKPPATATSAVIRNEDLGIVAWVHGDQKPRVRTNEENLPTPRSSGNGESARVATTTANDSQPDTDIAVPMRWQFRLNVSQYYTINKNTGITGWTDSWEESTKFPVAIGEINHAHITVLHTLYNVVRCVSDENSCTITTDQDGTMTIEKTSGRTVQITWSRRGIEPYTFRVERK